METPPELHPFVVSSVAALAGDAKRLGRLLSAGDLPAAKTLLGGLAARLDELEKFQIRCLSAEYREKAR